MPSTCTRTRQALAGAEEIRGHGPQVVPADRRRQRRADRHRLEQYRVPRLGGRSPTRSALETRSAAGSSRGGTNASLGRAELSDGSPLKAATESATAVSAVTCQRVGADPPWAYELADAGRP